MSYLVRKLYKRENIEKIGQADSVETMYADGAVGEFRTNSGTLSTWEIQSLEQIDDAVLAILVTSSDITKMDFVIINTKLLDTNGLLYNRTYAGQDIAVPDLQDTHFDILDITIPKLINCSKVFKQIYIDDNDSIILKKYEPACIFCGDAKDVFNYNGKNICTECAKRMGVYAKE